MIRLDSYHPSFSLFFLSVLFCSVSPGGKTKKKTPKILECDTFDKISPRSPVSIPNCSLYLLDDAVLQRLLFFSFFAYLFTVVAD